jgi:hypothetical protein
LTITAYADKKQKIVVPADAPPVYLKECGGGCHVAFPPALLSASDWQTIMSKLDKHYGDNAVIPDQERQEITDFLVRNAGSGIGSGGGVSSLPKLTATRWFRREHHEIPATLWSGKQVGRPSNCGACHSQAEQGSFDEDEVRLPGDARRGHHH